MVAPKRDFELQKIAAEATWKVSTAVVVDGILRLYSSNPKRDANRMRDGGVHKREVLREGPRDSSPLREVYFEGNDALIYKMVFNYLKAAEAVFWTDGSEGSFILRTIGVQTVFDILRKIAAKAYQDKDISSGYFEAHLEPAKKIDLSTPEFRNASGSGRTFIRKTIEKAIGIER